MALHRILAFDGGPAAPTYLRALLELERRAPGTLDATDLFIGTSNGAFAAVYLAARATRDGKLDAAALEDCIRFVDAVSACVKPGIRSTLRFLTGLRPMFGLEQVLEKLEEGTAGPDGQPYLLSELSRRVAAISFDMTFPKMPRIIHNGPTRDTEGPTQSLKASEAAMRSAAFPIVFPMRFAHIDGGTVANNPSTAGLALAGAWTRMRDGWGDGGDFVAEETGVGHFEDVRMISWGGQNPAVARNESLGPLAGPAHKWLKNQLRDSAGDVRPWTAWGPFQWLALPVLPLQLINIAVNGGDRLGAFECDSILGPDRFQRVALPLPRGSLGEIADILTHNVPGAKDAAREAVDRWIAGDLLQSTQRRVGEPEPISPLLRRQLALPSVEELVAWVEQHWMRG